MRKFLLALLILLIVLLLIPETGEALWEVISSGFMCILYLVSFCLMLFGSWIIGSFVESIFGWDKRK